MSPYPLFALGAVSCYPIYWGNSSFTVSGWATMNEMRGHSIQSMHDGELSDKLPVNM